MRQPLLFGSFTGQALAFQGNSGLIGDPVEDSHPTITEPVGLLSVTHNQEAEYLAPRLKGQHQEVRAGQCRSDIRGQGLAPGVAP